jgi:hypothetical protein
MLEQANAISVPERTQPHRMPDTNPGTASAQQNRHAPFDPEARTAGPIPTFGQHGARQCDHYAQNAHAYSPPVKRNAERHAPDLAYHTMENEDEYTFGDIIDMINPLQHLPIIGTLYRKFTGDTIKPMSNIIGGAIFGGPVGAVSSTINVVAKSTTGKDIAENAFALVGFDVSPQPKAPLIAYEKAASLAPQATTNAANLIQISSASDGVYTVTESGHRNFAARNASTQSWNA